jgi:hypothetical protein
MKIVRAKLIFQSKDTLLFKTMTVIIILKKEEEEEAKRYMYKKDTKAARIYLTE